MTDAGEVVELFVGLGDSNQQYGIRVLLTSNADIEQNDLRHNTLGAFDIDKDPLYLVQEDNQLS